MIRTTVVTAIPMKSGFFEGAPEDDERTSEADGVACCGIRVVEIVLNDLGVEAGNGAGLGAGSGGRHSTQ
jgi:hypothetical protein